MSHQNLLVWEKERLATWRKDITLLNHKLASLPIFSDEGLIDILERHPKPYLYAHTMNPDPTDPQWQTGKHDHLKATELLDAVKRGRLWLNIKKVNETSGPLAQAINQLYDELKGVLVGFKPFDVKTTLIISSPTAAVYYHADGPANMLWHVRGKKRFWVYPADNETYAPRALMEQIFAREASEGLPYKPEFDAHAHVQDLNPGEALLWPQNSPHRVTNLEGLNVSISTEHYTPEALLKEHAFWSNRYFNKRFGLNLSSLETSGLGYFLKRNTFRTLRKMGFVPHYSRKHVYSFEVDPQAPLCVKPVSVKNEALK